MSGSTHVARALQHSAQDTVRWGDSFGIALGNPNALAQALANAKAQRGAQLVNAHWRWPLTWQVAFILFPQFDPTETGSLTVRFAVTIGSGSSQMTFNRDVTVPASATHVYTTVVDTGLILPAQDLLITPILITTPDGSPLGSSGDTLEIGAFAAPQTEAHAMLQMLECLCRLEENLCRLEEKMGGGADERRGDWMPPGFTPEPLAYGR